VRPVPADTGPAANTPQHRRHAVHRRPAVLLQQGPVLRMDGHDKAAFRRRQHHHDVLVGPRQDEDQWRRERAGTNAQDGRREARVRLPGAHGAHLQPPGMRTPISHAQDASSQA
jgi:hypothetical protein